MNSGLKKSLLLALLVAPAYASDLRVPATVLNVYDGDTLTVQAEIWPGLTWRGSVRVQGVDTPEIRGRCEEERRLALAARDFVQTAVGQTVTLSDIKQGKYAGRVVATVLLSDGRDLAEELLAAGHARSYTGGKRHGWCP